jgi:hypothetical protein
MGKASSSKKVARAARAGGAARTGERRKLTFPLSIFAIVVVGTLLVVFARIDRNEGVASAESPTTADHWHAAYGVFVCDAFLPPLSDVKADTTGIHTHADGIIHIHPFSDAATGKNATLSKWGETVDIDFGGDSVTVQGEKYEDGYDCNGEPANVVIHEWPADDLEAAPEIFTSDFGGIRLDQDRAAITIAVVPEGTEVPRPDSVPTLDNLSDVEGTGGTAPTTAPADPGAADPSASVPAAADPAADASSTTAPAESSATTAAPQ